mmetsp:Transcript_4349/g.5812  ORF Transcript_4349/g.5812 Transcript_4349/m.5812 type:complete len:112 (-) Transcript_4349:295-630(-)
MTRKRSDSKSSENTQTPKAENSTTDTSDFSFMWKHTENLGKERTATQYAKTNPTYMPLLGGEKIPSMAQLWAYANRRYSKYSGYAWGGVAAVGGFVFLIKQFVTEPKKESS